MALQANNNFSYNYSTYSNPYFRLTLHLPQSGEQTPVDAHMYTSYEDYTASMSPARGYEGPGCINTISVYVPSTGAPSTSTGSTVIDQYLYWISQQVVIKLQEFSPSTTFTITDIPS